MRMRRTGLGHSCSRYVGIQFVQTRWTIHDTPREFRIRLKSSRPRLELLRAKNIVRLILLVRPQAPQRGTRPIRVAPLRCHQGATVLRHLVVPTVTRHRGLQSRYFPARRRGLLALLNTLLQHLRCTGRAGQRGQSRLPKLLSNCTFPSSDEQRAWLMYTIRLEIFILRQAQCGFELHMDRVIANLRPGAPQPVIPALLDAMLLLVSVRYPFCYSIRGAKTHVGVPFCGRQRSEGLGRRVFGSY